MPNVNETEIKLPHIHITDGTMYKLVQSFRKAIWPYANKTTKLFKLRNFLGVICNYFLKTWEHSNLKYEKNYTQKYIYYIIIYNSRTIKRKLNVQQENG